MNKFQRISLNMYLRNNTNWSSPHNKEVCSIPPTAIYVAQYIGEYFTFDYYINNNQIYRKAIDGFKESHSIFDVLKD
jgi:hypothetical protein